MPPLNGKGQGCTPLFMGVQLPKIMKFKFRIYPDLPLGNIDGFLVHLCYRFFFHK